MNAAPTSTASPFVRSASSSPDDVGILGGNSAPGGGGGAASQSASSQANAKLQENDVGNTKLNIPFSNDAINRSKFIIFLLYYTTIFYPEGLEAMIILTLLI